MTIVWLIVWLIAATPDVAVLGPWNSWGIALAVCFAIDLLGALRANTGTCPRRRLEH